MAGYTTADIRNVALVGHGAVGKTSLGEVMLHLAGAVSRLGSVDDGTSVSDFDEEERERKYSIDTSLLHVPCEDRQVTLVDTPGYPDFIGGTIAAMHAVETAVVVIGAPAGIEVNTRRVFAEAVRLGLGRMIVINKMDGENIDFAALVSAIQETFGRSCMVMNAPVGHGESFSGVVDVLGATETPDGALIDVAEASQPLLESIVEADEAMVERYLAEEALQPEEITRTVRRAVAQGALVPIFCTSARKQIGVQELLQAIARYTPSPADGLKRQAVHGKGDSAETVELEPLPGAPLVGQVFKSVTDDFVGKMSFFRVYQGRLASESSAVNARTGKSSRLGQLMRVQGKEHEPVPEAIPGDIVAVVKVEDFEINDTLVAGKDRWTMTPIVVPTPMVALAAEPKSRGDEQKISSSLARMASEDPTFQTRRDLQTRELVITGMSQLHLEVIRNRLKHRYKLEMVTKTPRVPYRETVTTKGEGHYKHKKQTGGRGQFGEVYLRVEPTERDAGFEFENAIFGGSIPGQYVPAVEKGVREAMERGPVAGYAVQDVRVTVHDGSYHSVDSSEAAFKIAASRAFQDAFMKAKPVLLEPVAMVEISIPSQYLGDITGDLNGRRGRIQGMDTLPGDLHVIRAQVPLAEVLHYATELRSITGGQGSYAMEASHYDVVPPNVQQQIAQRARREQAEGDE